MFILYINLPYIQGSYKTGFYTYLQKLPTPLLTTNSESALNSNENRYVLYKQLKELKISYLFPKK